MSAPPFLFFCGLVSFAVLLIEKKDLDGLGQVLSAALEVVRFSVVTQFHTYINLISFCSSSSRKLDFDTCYRSLFCGNFFDSMHHDTINCFWQIAEEENLEADSKFRALVAIGSMVFSYYYFTYISL